MTPHGYFWTAMWTFCPLQPVICTTCSVVDNIEEGANGSIVVTEEAARPGHTRLLGAKPRFALDLNTGQRIDGTALGTRSAADLLLNEDVCRVPVREALILRYCDEPTPSVFAVQNEGRREQAVLLWRWSKLYKPRRFLSQRQRTASDPPMTNGKTHNRSSP